MIAIFDNSLRTTGAFKSALILAEVARAEAEVVFILPKNSTLSAQVESMGYRVVKISVMEIRRKWKNLLLYVPYLLLNSLYLRTFLRSNSVDLLVMNDYHNLLGAAVKILGWRGRLVTYVRRLPSSHPGLLNSVWSTMALRYSSTVVAVSNAVFEQLPDSAKKIKIYNVLDADERYGPSLLENTDLFTFLYLGNYMEGKGQRLALEAFAAVATDHPSARLRFFGDDMGVDANKKFRSSLVEFARQTGIADKVEFNPYTNDIEYEIKRANIVLNFSYAESFSRTCLEAGYYGRGVIASRCGGPEEIILEGETGLLVGNRIVDEMIAAMSSVLGNPGSADRMGASARAHVRQRFSLSATAPLVRTYVLGRLN